MIPYSVYKIVHLVGILMVFLSLGGVATTAIDGGARNLAWRKLVAVNHGVGLLLSLVGGFGLLARLGLAKEGLPGWIIAKLGVWVIFATLVALLPRKPQWAKFIWFGMIVFGGTAAYLAGSKPIL